MFGRKRIKELEVELHIKEWNISFYKDMIDNYRKLISKKSVENLLLSQKAEPINTIQSIKQWVIDRNLHTQDPKVQMCKVVEELGELAKAINKNDREQQIDGIGDVVVTLVCISEQLKLNFDDCVLAAYNEIKDRKGKLIGGTFVKEENL